MPTSAITIFTIPTLEWYEGGGGGGGGGGGELVVGVGAAAGPGHSSTLYTGTQLQLHVSNSVYLYNHSWASCPLSPVICKKKFLTDLTSVTFSQI